MEAVFAQEIAAALNTPVYDLHVRLGEGPLRNITIVQGRLGIPDPQEAPVDDGAVAENGKDHSGGAATGDNELILTDSRISISTTASFVSLAEFAELERQTQRQNHPRGTTQGKLAQGWTRIKQTVKRVFTRRRR